MQVTETELGLEPALCLAPVRGGQVPGAPDGLAGVGRARPAGSCGSRAGERAAARRAEPSRSPRAPAHRCRGSPQGAPGPLPPLPSAWGTGRCAPLASRAAPLFYIFLEPEFSWSGGQGRAGKGGRHGRASALAAASRPSGAGPGGGGAGRPRGAETLPHLSRLGLSPDPPACAGHFESVPAPWQILKLSAPVSRSFNPRTL